MALFPLVGGVAHGSRWEQEGEHATHLLDAAFAVLFVKVNDDFGIGACIKGVALPLERELSRFLPNSDITRINHLAAGERARVAPSTLVVLPVKRVITNKWFVLGVSAMALAFFSLLFALSHDDVSLVAPAAASLSFVTNAIAAKFYLHERVDARRWAAAVCVCGGVALLAL